MLKPVEKKRHMRTLLQQIRTLIDEGKLKRNDHLPSERDLSETFRVSRTTVREAIRTMESMKLLQKPPGRRHLCSCFERRVFDNSLWQRLFLMRRMTFRDIFYIRKIIEPHVAELAAENATPQGN